MLGEECLHICSAGAHRQAYAVPVAPAHSEAVAWRDILRHHSGKSNLCIYSESKDIVGRVGVELQDLEAYFVEAHPSLVKAPGERVDEMKHDEQSSWQFVLNG